MISNRDDEEGFVLITVLLILGFLAFLVSHINTNSRTVARIVQSSIIHTELESAANGAIDLAIFHLLQTGSSQWSPDNQWHSVAIVPYLKVRVHIVPGNMKINPSFASLGILESAFRMCGLSREDGQLVANSIFQWRNNQNNFQAVSFYKSLNKNWGPSGHTFYSIADLQYVQGMTHSLLECLSPHLSFIQIGSADQLSADSWVANVIKEQSIGDDVTTYASASSNFLGQSFEAYIEVLVEGMGKSLKHSAYVELSPENKNFPISIKNYVVD